MSEPLLEERDFLGGFGRACDVEDLELFPGQGEPDRNSRHVDLAGGGRSHVTYEPTIGQRGQDRVREIAGAEKDLRQRTIGRFGPPSGDVGHGGCEETTPDPKRPCAGRPAHGNGANRSW